MNPYLASSQPIDWHHRDVAQKAADLAEGCSSEEALARSCFEFVRDSLKHSWVAALTCYTTVEQVAENLPDIEIIES